MLLTPTIVLGLLSAASACSDHADGRVHEHSRRAASSFLLTPPTRPLQWGDINIIHTTDTHGWLLGHQKSSFPEPNYSADFGDFASFVTRMKEIATERDVDLLLVDSGDLHDGTGLSDGFPPGGVDGHDSNQFIKKLPYDVLAIGNHELYQYDITLDMHTNFAPAFPGRYLSSNVNITVEGQAPPGVPVGSRFAKFKTQKGRKVTSLGVLFDFTGNAKNTTVQKVADMVKETWFADAIKEEPDFFLLAGHMPVDDGNWSVVFKAVRAVHPLTPILILGGHTHIRDCLQLDGRSMALESGRFMETVGWMSVNLTHQGNNENLAFSRRYLDANRVSYEFHTMEATLGFDTQDGQSITRGLSDLATEYDLSFQFGTAPHDFTLTQSPYPSNDSLLTLYVQEALPVALAINNTRSSIPKIIIANSRGLRFDVYAGPFTKNDQMTTSVYTDGFLFIPNITFSVANQVLPALNPPGANHRRALEEREKELYARGDVDMVYRMWLEEMDRRNEIERRDVKDLTLGYVTTDSCPGVGDDVPHIPISVYPFPDNIGSVPPDVSADTPIDLVFTEHVSSRVLKALNSIQTIKHYTQADTQRYSHILTNEVLGLFAQKAWN